LATPQHFAEAAAWLTPSAASGTIAATPGPINAWAAHYIHVLSGILLTVAGVAGGRFDRSQRPARLAG